MSWLCFQVTPLNLAPSPIHGRCPAPDVTLCCWRISERTMSWMKPRTHLCRMTHLSPLCLRWVNWPSRGISEKWLIEVHFLIADSFCSLPNPTEPIGTNCCTWHDSCAVLASAKVCNSIIAMNRITVKQSFNLIWIVMEKALLKWVPGPKMRSEIRAWESSSKGKGFSCCYGNLLIGLPALGLASISRIGI